ncbi:hypothetical protein ALEK_3043 [Poseidonibacter lekithochrous]|nr:hypothetical protein ALEK_3043 [Poseidonibacter lekithochrous]
MKIEFKKVPQSPKEFSSVLDSVEISGTFCKISQSLVKIDAVLNGNTTIDCCRCGITDSITINEKANFLLSDGIYQDTESEDLVIEIDNSIIDFDEIIGSEIESIKSDYYLCDKCTQDNDYEQEF